MFLLRRAAARGLASQSLAAKRTTRSLTSFTSQIPKVQSTWQSSSIKRFYSDESKPAATDGEASPAEAEGGETTEVEPSAEEQKNITEQSVADGATADARTVTDSVSSAVSNAAGAVQNAFGGASSSFQEPPPESKILYVGNLYFDLTPDQLRDKFAEIGQVVNSKIVTDSSGRSKGFGYIEYETLEEARRAIEVLNEDDLEGRRMRVQYHQRRAGGATRSPMSNGGTLNKPSSTLFVGNISFQMSDKDLNDLFRSVQGVVDVRVAVDRRSGQPRGFAHADFRTTEAALAAKAILEQKVMYGRQLRIDFGLPSGASRGSRQE